MAVQHIEKKKGRRYSVVLFIFWLTQSVVSYLALRSYLYWWQQHNETSRAMLLHDTKLLVYLAEFTLVALSFVLACCSERSAQLDREKSKAKKSQREKPSEQTAGMFSYLTFWWAN